MLGNALSDVVMVTSRTLVVVLFRGGYDIYVIRVDAASTATAHWR